MQKLMTGTVNIQAEKYRIASNKYSALNNASSWKRHESVSVADGAPTSDLGAKIKLAMRKIPHPLAIVTAGLHTRPKGPPSTLDQSPKHLTGLLISSFNTITLTPVPYVSFNIKLPSATYDAISRQGTFEISPPWHSRTAHIFGGTLKRASDEKNGKLLSKYVETKPFNLSAKRAFGLKCQWIPEKSVEIGDHKIMIGKVLEFVEPDPGAERHKALIWSEGQLRIASKPLWELFMERKALARRNWKLKEVEILGKKSGFEAEVEDEEDAFYEQVREAENSYNAH